MPPTLGAMALALVLVPGCGGDDVDTAGNDTTDDTGPRSTTTDGRDPSDRPLDAELVAFVAGSTATVDAPAALLGTPQEVAAWVGWFEAADRDQAAALRDAVSGWSGGADGEVLVAFAPTGCGENGARLVLAGSDLDVDLTGGEDIRCAVAVGFTVVFAVDAQDLPHDVTLAGRPAPDQVGPGVVAFLEDFGVTTPPPGDATVLDPSTVDAWTSELAASGIDVVTEVAGLLGRLGSDERAVGAAVQGCGERGAELVIGPGPELDVALVDRGDVVCDAAATYVVLLVVDAALLPV